MKRKRQRLKKRIHKLKPLVHFDDIVKTLCGLFKEKKLKVVISNELVTCPLCKKIYREIRGSADYFKKRGE
jgi:hypothetical protein